MCPAHNKYFNYVEPKFILTIVLFCFIVVKKTCVLVIFNFNKLNMDLAIIVLFYLKFLVVDQRVFNSILKFAKKLRGV